MKLEADIREASRYGPSREDWLAWIVYAAEIGYRYKGDEYWQTFREGAPGWSATYDSCDQIRGWFRRFGDEFGGFQPTSRWAKCFTIICWPIAHAILPQDLQRQLAQVLYELRHSFTPELLQSAAALGERIAARSAHANTRFREIAQETLLIGQIARALLLRSEQEEPSPLIEGATLARIADDLAREQRAREWLRDAQRSAKQIDLRGLRRPSVSTGRADSGGSPAQIHSGRERAAALAIEPSLSLLPGDERWRVVLDAPDLSAVADQLPGARHTLMTSRCVVAGSDSRPLARGALLHGGQRILLREWPAAGDVLLRFDPSSPELDALLRTDCLLRPGPLWLFKVASDGFAYEVRSLAVRPDQSYVLVSTNLIQASANAKPARLDCRGVHAVQFTLPPAVPEDLEQDLTQRGLHLARRLEVWPAGLPAASWDGEGRGEWLTSDRPTIGIRADFAIASLDLTLDAQPATSLRVASSEVGAPIFVELSELPIGVHPLRVTARAVEGKEGEGELDLAVREPRPWIPGVARHGAFSVTVEPVAPTLEELWEGRVTIDIRGPAARQVTGALTLYQRGVDAPLITHGLDPLQLPVSAQALRSRLSAWRRAAANAYDAAQSCSLELRAEELGRYSLVCERSFTPIRWTRKRAGRSAALRLVNDTGSGLEVVVEHYTFDEPDAPIRLQEDFAAPTTPKGVGLYVASVSDHRCMIIIPPLESTLADLKRPPTLKAWPRTASSLTELLAVIELWTNARLTGDAPSSTHWHKVLRPLVAKLFGLLGGERWDSAERIYHRKRTAPDALMTLRSAISAGFGDGEIGRVLFDDREGLAEDSPRERIGHLTRLMPKLLGSREWTCELALRLASHPEGVREWAGDRLTRGLEDLLGSCSIVARAARFLVLAIESVESTPLKGGELYAGWDWT